MSGVFEWIMFLSLSLVAIVTAAGMLLTMSMYRAGLALMASFVALAGLFILLGADLLAAIQIMMNVGGMLVMVLFMVMMMMDPGGEMMWAMKRDMHLPGPGAFSMHMPWGKPAKEEPPQQQDGQEVEWTCPMHPQVSQPGPGSCPKCGMSLIPRAEVADERSSHEMVSQEQVYSCPMHPEVQQAQPGKCPKCGMTLIAVEQQPTSHAQVGEIATYSCPMHPEVQQHQPGNCPKCGMQLVKQEPVTESQEVNEQQHMAMEHSHTAHMEMPEDTTGKTGHTMEMSHEMNMSGMTPGQYYEMMVDMAMSTAQLPWAIALGVLSAMLLIVLVVLTPWPLAHTGPTQDATTAVGELLLSRYMIGFEGAAFLILAGIAGAVLFAQRARRAGQAQLEHEGPVAAEVRQSQPGTCPKCGMTLMSVEQTPAAHGESHAHGTHEEQGDQREQGGHV
jgi:NADH:ubiquinone oxidoreductase subunit 6 (subunit J)